MYIHRVLCACVCHLPLSMSASSAGDFGCPFCSDVSHTLRLYSIEFAQRLWHLVGIVPLFSFLLQYFSISARPSCDRAPSFLYCCFFFFLLSSFLLGSLHLFSDPSHRPKASFLLRCKYFRRSFKVCVFPLAWSPSLSLNPPSSRKTSEKNSTTSAIHSNSSSSSGTSVASSSTTDCAGTKRGEGKEGEEHQGDPDKSQDEQDSSGELVFPQTTRQQIHTQGYRDTGLNLSEEVAICFVICVIPIHSK